MSLIGSTSFGFAQNTVSDFQNTLSPIELIVALSSTNATKMLQVPRLNFTDLQCLRDITCLTHVQYKI